MRAQHIAIAIVYSALAIVSGAFLFGCDSDSSTGAPAQDAGIIPLKTSALGAWEADTVLQVTSPVGVLAPKVVICDTIRADSTFSAAVYVRDLLQGNSVQGSLHTRLGTWAVIGDSLLILNSLVCEQSDTTVVMGLSLPFSFPGLVANPRKTVACGAPDTVRTRPQADGHWKVPMNVQMQGIASGNWILDFVRQP